MDETNYDAISYKAPFIREVVLKLDFPTPITEFADSLPQSLANIIIGQFPIAEPRKTQAHSVAISNNAQEPSNISVQASQTEMRDWLYHGINRDKTLVLNQNTFIASFRKYTSFENFQENIYPSVDELFRLYPNLHINRVGLRYINVIEQKVAKNPLVWNKLINKSLLSSLDFANTEKEKISRAFSVLEFNFDGEFITFQYGISNPDYPAPIRQKQFVLDLDGYSIGAFGKLEMKECAKKAHSRIQKIFESAILDDTRKIMNAEDNS